MFNSFVLFFIGSFSFVLNTIVFGFFATVFGVLRFAFKRIKILDSFFVLILNNINWSWHFANHIILKFIYNFSINVHWPDGEDFLSPNKNYFLISNHSSGFDISVLGIVLYKKVPSLKFFLKKELLMTPFLGTACWALDMVFVSKNSSRKLKKSMLKNLSLIKKSCLQMMQNPFVLVSFLEGSRHNLNVKSKKANISEYEFLLKPKVSGSVIAMSVLKKSVFKVIDITIIYPKVDNKKPHLYNIFSCKIKKVDVIVRFFDLPDIDYKSYSEDAEVKNSFKNWIDSVWSSKDLLIKNFYSQSSDK